MDKISATIALLIFSSSSFAEEKDSNQRISIYMHPTSFLFSTYISAISQEPNFYLAFTGEVPLGKYASIVLVPSVFNTTNGFVNGWETFKVGSGIGVRLFPNGKTEGFYFQFMPGLYYVKKENYEGGIEDRDEYYIEHIENIRSGIYIDALVYVGYSFKFSKFSMFLDIGGGLGFPKKFEILLDGPLKFDINFGIGIPL